MKKMKFLTQASFRLLTLILCMAATIPQLMAQTYTVAGNDTRALAGSSWAPADANNDMSLYSDNMYYLLKTVTYPSSSSYEYKITVNHSWDTSYGNNGGSDNASYSVNSGTGFVCYTFNSITHVPHVVSSLQTIVIAGSDTQALGSSTWNGTNTANSMTTTDGITYTMTKTVDYTASVSNLQCKAVVANTDWYGTSSGDNVYYNIPSAGSYTVTYTFNAVTGIVSVDVQSATPVTPTYYITGDAGLGLDGWSFTPTITMNYDTDNDVYTYSYNVTAMGTYYFAFADGGGSSWDDFNGNHRYGPSGGNVEVSPDGTWVTTQKGRDSYYVTVDPGLVTITFDIANSRFKVSGTEHVTQVYTYDIYVRYTGIEDIASVNIYAWDNDGELSAAWSGNSLSTLTSQVINGFTYYHVTYTSYNSTIGVIFNEFNENGSTQTANLTAIPGDNYFTYDGGSTVDGPNEEADARTEMYLIGYANSQQWAANNGIPMVWDADNNYYKLERVVLTARSNFAFATQLAETSDDWDTLNSYRLISIGDNNWNITVDQLDDWIKYDDYVDNDNHNWYVEQAGSYNIYVHPGTRCIMVESLHDDMYISHGVNWDYLLNSDQMTTVDGNVYQTTITLNNGDYFLFSTNLSDESAWGAEDVSYEITDLMINFAQKLQPGSTNNFYFNGTTGRYIVVVNKAKNTVTLRKTYDATKTKIYLQKTPNVTLNPAGGTYNNQPVGNNRGGIYAWNNLNLEAQNGQTYTVSDHGPTNYTYDGEVGNSYDGDGKLKDMNDTITFDGKEWYAWSVSNSICEFYFIRNNQEDYKSQNIIRRAGEVWLTWIDKEATSNRQPNAQQCDSLQDVTREYYDVTTSGVSDCATMLEGHYYVYYTNTTGWDSVYCYAWHSDPLIEYNGGYPGSKCTFVGYDNDGYEVWCYDFGLIDDFNQQPTGIIFNNGRGGEAEGQAGDAVRQQTGDLEFNNGACYDYLGMIYLGNSLNAIINGGVVNGPKYTVEDDLIGVYYDDDAITRITAVDHEGNEIDYYVKGALYAKDMENYSAKSRPAEGTTDYVYNTCAHWKSQEYPGGSQIQLKRTYYDQSNWVKIVLSPNFDNGNAKSNADVTIDASQFDDMTYSRAEQLTKGYLERYVGKVIPGHSMSGNLVDKVNPQMHITNIARPEETTEYEKNVYVTTHFNDSIVFSYVHQEWSPGIYKGVYRTVPHLAVDDETGEYLTDSNGNYFVDYTEIKTDSLYKMFYVAPKPQEIAYITWAVFDHPDENVGTSSCYDEPKSPGAFYTPMNWNRTGQLWGTDPESPNAAWGETYGPFSNGYMQYGGFQVNWSLFGDDMHLNGYGQPWYQIFKPGQAYKILALIRYAWGDDLSDVKHTAGVIDENYEGEYNDGRGDHVYNAPRRANYTDVSDMEIVPFPLLNNSKFIVFPLMGSAEDSNGDDMGNVTVVKEVYTPRTVTGVHYYNLMGARSDKPFDGINIVVTTYSDGSRTSKKILR